MDERYILSCQSQDLAGHLTRERKRPENLIADPTASPSPSLVSESIASPESIKLAVEPIIG